MTRASCVLFACVLATASHAQAAESRTASAREQARRVTESLGAKYGGTWRVRLGPDGRVTSLLSRATKPTEGAARELAQAFLRENASLLALRADLGDLTLTESRRSLGGERVVYEQRVDGVRVEGAAVTLNFDREGRILSVDSTYVPGVKVDLAAKLSEREAIETATERLLANPPRPPSRKRQQVAEIVSRDQLQLREEPKAVKIVFSFEGKWVLAYKVVIAARRPVAHGEYVIDAQTGRILRERGLIRSAVDGQGQVFIPNPICVMNDGTLRDSGDAASAVPAGAYSSVPLRDLDDAVSGNFSIRGLYSRSEDIESPGTALTTAATSTFNFDRSQAGFEEVNIYYHIDTLQRYYQSLGFIDANNRQVRFDAHGDSGSDNALYDPSPSGAGFLSIGDGGSDGGEDAEMVVHEYGHATQDNQNPDAFPPSGQAGAIGEGFGDYIAASTFLAASTASGWDSACLMEWDAVNFDADTCERRVDTNKTYPASYVGEVHDDGEIWSRALWDMLNHLGKTTADRLAIQSSYNVPLEPTFKQGADAVLTADLQLFYGSHLEQLCTIFMNRGIYAAADCPQLPPSSGGQSALVALVKYSDLAAEPLTPADVTTRVNAWNAYLAEVSYGQVSLNATIRGWVTLPHARSDYLDGTTSSVLIELVGDTLAAVAAADPALSLPGFDRLIIITNDDGTGAFTQGDKDWATTGPWPYDLPASLGRKRLSVSVHRAAHGEAHFTHALGHHFGLFDLYAHEGVTFPRRYVDGWCNMAKSPAGTFTNVHFLGWNKLRGEWLDSSDVTFIPRPPADPAPGHQHLQSYPLEPQEADAAQPELIQIGTTAGSATRDDETVSYFVEARRTTGTYEAGLPSDGVIVYYANQSIGQGVGPVRLVDFTPADNDLTNAALRNVGDALNNIDGTGLDVRLVAPIGGETYRVEVNYDPPETDVDAWIHARDGNWRSADIWVDHAGCNGLGVCGFDDPASATDPRQPADRGDLPRPGEVNRLYARVYNHGPGTAHNVRVDFWLSDPYQGIDGGGTDPDTGGNVAFNKHYFTVIEDLPPTDTGVPVYVEWTPNPVLAGQTSVHACVKVKIAQVFNDTNDFNQVSQENIHEYDTTHGSPYAPVTQPFRVANPYDHPILVYLRADDVPVGWETELVPEKAYLAVGGSVDATITIRPPEDYLVCSSELITVSAWYPSGDTLVELGGTTAQVNLKSSTALTTQTQVSPCKRGLSTTAVMAAEAAGTQTCQQITTKGCTTPPRPYEHIWVQYTGPDGNPIYHEVVTDANGCYEDFLVSPSGGIWQAEASYPGNHCAAGDETPGPPVIVIPSGPSPARGIWYSFNLGMGFPVGSFNREFDPGPNLVLDVERSLTDRLALHAMLGFHHFHGDGVPDTYYTTLLADVRATWPVLGWEWYLEAGPGFYFPKTGATKAGLNLGTGWVFRIEPRLALEVGARQHLVDPGTGSRSFTDLTMGLRFRF